MEAVNTMDTLFDTPTAASPSAPPRARSQRTATPAPDSATVQLAMVGLDGTLLDPMPKRARRRMPNRPSTGVVRFEKMAPRKDAYTVTTPRPGQTWCSANTSLYLNTLADPPTPSARASTRKVYETAVETGRQLCVQKCPLWVSCLRQALEGPTNAGFIAGTTAAERDALRDALDVSERVVHVQDFTDAKRVQGEYVDHDHIWILRDLCPDVTRTELAERAGCSEVTVKRVLGRQRPVPRDLGASVSAYRSRYPKDTYTQIADAFHVTSEQVRQVVEEPATSVQVSEYDLRGAYDTVVLGPVTDEDDKPARRGRSRSRR